MITKNPFKNSISKQAWKKKKPLFRFWRQELCWRLNLKSWISANRINEFQNRHCRERCFIIGNGPSLNNIDLSLLQNEYTFGTNRIYLLFPKIGFFTSYYVSVNQLILDQFSEEISQLRMPKFLNRKKYKSFPFTENTMFIHPRPGLDFSKNPRYYIFEGATVTFVALQLAYFMGFERVILIGIDHNFRTKGIPHKETISEGNDPNHFAPNYFGKGVRWQLPDLKTSEVSYEIAFDAFRADNRTIVDATLGGKLEIFPKVSYTDQF